MTAAQKKNIERFKKAAAEAKKLRKKNPKLTQAEAIKEAFRILYKKGKVVKKVGYSKERIQAHKELTKAIKSQPKELFPYTKKQTIIKGGKKYFDEMAKKIHTVGATTKKPARKKATAKNYHKDTKSHNVRINVVSGVDKISDFSLLQIKRNNESIERLSKVVLQNKEKVKTFQYNNPFWKNYFKKKNKEINDYIKTLKKQNTELKKHI